MVIFTVDGDSTPEAALLAKGFKVEVNNDFEKQRLECYDAIQRFWFRNLDESGQPIATASPVERHPTGPEILEALGTDAKAVMMAAYIRVTKLQDMVLSLGLDVSLIDASKLRMPYSLTYNDDGSLQQAELEQWYLDLHPELTQTEEPVSE